ncbi:Trk system potassium uptake protein TrkH [termite gut metagenome]|uniref:Trk system potassium uptake protein TrkH n=1 Tax=termite gut metagenome TaxID=433724 RepID=A0A5J4QT22_9ZZZZ
MIYRIMGFLVLVETMMLLCSAGVSFFFAEDDLKAFIVTSVITGLVGTGLLFAGKKAVKEFGRRDSIIIVSTSWIVVSIFGLLPFYISGYIPSITNAFFETMSGFTSTGSTILDDIEALPHGLLFWRSLTQWIGGLGIVLFTIAVLPIFGIGGLQLFAAETGGMSYDKVFPRIGVTAKWIWSIYLGLTGIVAGLLLLGGMGIFDSICHSFTTAATGGYSTKQASIAYYHSPYIEGVISISSILSGINFSLLLLFANGKFKRFFQDAELKWYLTSIIIFIIIVTIGLNHTTALGIKESFRRAFFQVSSIHTSTGFSTGDYMTWEPVLWGILVVLMIIGGCAGSTTGGLKCIRMLILAKVSGNEFKRIIHPNAVLPVKVNKQVVSPNIMSGVLSFLFIYLMIIVLGALFMMALGIDFTEAIGAVISSIGNTGSGIGLTGPVHSWNFLPDSGKWFLSFLMLIGRLELFTILILFTPNFWERN